LQKSYDLFEKRGHSHVFVSLSKKLKAESTTFFLLIRCRIPFQSLSALDARAKMVFLFPKMYVTGGSRFVQTVDPSSDQSILWKSCLLGFPRRLWEHGKFRLLNFHRLPSDGDKCVRLHKSALDPAQHLNSSTRYKLNYFSITYGQNTATHCYEEPIF